MGVTKKNMWEPKSKFAFENFLKIWSIYQVRNWQQWESNFDYIPN